MLFVFIRYGRWIASEPFPLVLIAANFSTEAQIIEFTSGIKIDLTPKSLKGKCTLNNLQLSLPACGYFLGEKDGH